MSFYLSSFVCLSLSLCFVLCICVLWRQQVTASVLFNHYFIIWDKVRHWTGRLLICLDWSQRSFWWKELNLGSYVCVASALLCKTSPPPYLVIKTFVHILIFFSYRSCTYLIYTLKFHLWRFLCKCYSAFHFDSTHSVKKYRIYLNRLNWSCILKPCHVCF